MINILYDNIRAINLVHLFVFIDCDCTWEEVKPVFVRLLLFCLVTGLCCFQVLKSEQGCANDTFMLFCGGLYIPLVFRFTSLDTVIFMIQKPLTVGTLLLDNVIGKRIKGEVHLRPNFSSRLFIHNQKTIWLIFWCYVDLWPTLIKWLKLLHITQNSLFVCFCFFH